MQKLLSIFLILLSFSVFAATERVNNVCFPGWGKVTFEFSATDLDNFVRTSGQPFSGIVPKSQPSEKYCFAVSSGRKNSVAVMNWLRNKYSVIAYARNLNPANFPVSAAYNHPAGYILPKEANFGIYGTLTFEKTIDKSKIILTCPDALIGQTGDYHPKVSGNIWFIFPTATNSYGEGFLRCEDQNKARRYIYMRAGRVTHGRLIVMDIPEAEDILDDTEMGIYSAAMSDNTFKTQLMD